MPDVGRALHSRFEQLPARLVAGEEALLEMVVRDVYGNVSGGEDRVTVEVDNVLEGTWSVSLLYTRCVCAIVCCCVCGAARWSCVLGRHASSTHDACNALHCFLTSPGCTSLVVAARGHGRYSAAYQPTRSGLVTITAAVNGEALGQAVTLPVVAGGAASMQLRQQEPWRCVAGRWGRCAGVVACVAAWVFLCSHVVPRVFFCVCLAGNQSRETSWQPLSLAMTRRTSPAASASQGRIRQRPHPRRCPCCSSGAQRRRIRPMAHHRHGRRGRHLCCVLHRQQGRSSACQGGAGRWAGGTGMCQRRVRCWGRLPAPLQGAACRHRGYCWYALHCTPCCVCCCRAGGMRVVEARVVVAGYVRIAHAQRTTPPVDRRTGRHPTRPP